MLSIDACSLIYTLRSIRTALDDHNTHLGATLATLSAQAELDQLIGLIEDVSQLLQAWPANECSSEEARLGPPAVQRPGPCSCSTCRGSSAADRRSR